VCEGRLETAESLTGSSLPQAQPVAAAATLILQSYDSVNVPYEDLRRMNRAFAARRGFAYELMYTTGRMPCFWQTVQVCVCVCVCMRMLA
jgi:hypothetical protein